MGRISFDRSTEPTTAHAPATATFQTACNLVHLHTHLELAFRKIANRGTLIHQAKNIDFLPTTLNAAIARHCVLCAHPTQTLASPAGGEAVLSPHFLACFPVNGEFFLSI